MSLQERRAYWIRRMLAGFPERFADDPEFRGAIEASAACFAEADLCRDTNPARSASLVEQANEHARHCGEHGPKLTPAELNKLMSFRNSLKERHHDRH